MKKNVLKELSFDFAVMIVNTYKQLAFKKKEYVMSKQLLRSGTAIGALYREAEQAESKADFVHKLAIAQKECNETLFWLELLNETGYVGKEFEELHGKASGLIRLLTKIIKTTKHNKLPQ